MQVGADVSRIEDKRILTGRGRYVDDIRLPDMVHAAFVRSPFPHATIDAIDTSAALALPGVLCVITGREVEAVTAPFQGGIPVPGMKVQQYHGLATDRARFVGDPVAIVVADTRAIAEDAAQLVDVDYGVLPPVADTTTALGPGAPVLFPELDDNLVYRTSGEFGDVEGAFRDADRVIAVTFDQHRYAAVPMETRGGIAAYDRGSEMLTYYAAGQSPHGLRQALAMTTRHPLERVRVVISDVGGSFGQKGMHSREYVALAVAALRLGRPVKWIEDRNENLLAGGQAREETVELRAAVTDDGRLLGLRARVVMDQGAYTGNPWSPGVYINKILKLLPGPYRWRGYAHEGLVAATNKSTYVAYRGPWEVETWARERLIDVVAHELGLDPADVRRLNMSDGDPDDRLITGLSIAKVTARESLDRALRRLDYAQAREEQATARAEGRCVGIGFANYIHLSPGPSETRGQPFDNERAKVRLEADGRLVVITAQSPHGQSQETTLAQVAADEMGMPLHDVRVIYGDTDLNPFGFLGTGGSRVAWAGGAVIHATRKLRQKVLLVASKLLGAPADALEIVDGVVRPIGATGGGITLGEIGQRSYVVPSVLPDNIPVDLEVNELYLGEDIGGTGWSGGTHACVVEVDLATGGVKILRWVAVEDSGQLINPAIVEGQIRGATAQGIGAVLLERSLYDDQAVPLATSLMDYLLPTATDVPYIEIEHILPAPGSSLDFRGIGEGGTVIAPAVLTNAIEDALTPFGARVTEQHLPPHRILEIAGLLGRGDRGQSPGSTL
jgi:carbon-monoxide dehydrogenase large subunit